MAPSGNIIFSYDAGQLTPLFTKPAWLEKAAQNLTDDWDKALKSADCEHVDSFGTEGERIAIYRTPDGGYFVDIWDVYRPVAQVVIEEASDYLRFRIEVLKPLAELSELIERQDERENDASGVR